MRWSRFVDLCGTQVPAVVVFVSNPGGVGVIRALGSEGVPVWGLDPHPDAIGFRSRYAYGSTVADGFYEEERFLADLVEVGERLPRKAVLIPAHDDYVAILARHADHLSRWFWVVTPPWEKLQLIIDKERQMRAAWQFEVDTPGTVFVKEWDDVASADGEVRFPALLKPAVPLAFRRKLGRKAVRVENLEELKRTYEQVQQYGDMLLQEFVPGGDDRLFGSGWYLDAESAPLAKFVYHKLRQHPRTFGEARFAESVWVPEVADAAQRLLRGLGQTGIFGCEFKRDPRDGRYRLMEINYRYCLSHTFARAVGVNIAHVAYRDAIGSPIVAPPQREGVKWTLSTTDVPDSVREIARGEMGVQEWLGSMRGTRCDGLQSVKDPLPGLHGIVQAASKKLAGRIPGRS